jgi:hypothetical protein
MSSVHKPDTGDEAMPTVGASPTDVAIGDRVRREMWERHIPYVRLAEKLGLDQSAGHRRLSGKTAWKVRELLIAAEMLGMAVEDLLPPGATMPTGEADEVAS